MKKESNQRTVQDGASWLEGLSKICERGGGIKSTAKIHKTGLCNFEPQRAIVCARRPTASNVLLAFLYVTRFWSLDFSKKGCIWPRMNRSHTSSSAGVMTIGRNLCVAWADCCLPGRGVTWTSLQDEGRIPWEREELMVSETKEHSSFAHFF